MPHNHHNFEYVDAALRKDLARRIAMGLARWEYCKSARGVGYLADEDAARVEICEIIQAQRHAFFVRKDVVPENWKEQICQMDIGIGIIDDPDPVKYAAIRTKMAVRQICEVVRERILFRILLGWRLSNPNIQQSGC